MLKLVKEFENISKEDIAASLGISMYMTKKIIKNLRDSNVLSYEGSSKAGKWVTR